MNSIDYDEWKEHHFALAMSLIKQGANINTQDERGTTFLMEVVRWGNLDYLHTLLKAGADPNIKNELGESALLWAAHQERPNAVRALLEYGANIEITDDFNYTAIAWAVVADNAEIVQVLLDSGANINVITVGNETLFDLASSSETKAVLNNYIKAKENTIIQDYRKSLLDTKSGLNDLLKY